MSISFEVSLPRDYGTAWYQGVAIVVL